MRLTNAALAAAGLSSTDIEVDLRPGVPVPQPLLMWLRAQTAGREESRTLADDLTPAAVTGKLAQPLSQRSESAMAALLVCVMEQLAESLASNSGSGGNGSGGSSNGGADEPQCAAAGQPDGTDMGRGHEGGKAGGGQGSQSAAAAGSPSELLPAAGEAGGLEGAESFLCHAATYLQSIGAIAAAAVKQARERQRDVCEDGHTHGGASSVVDTALS